MYMCVGQYVCVGLSYVYVCRYTCVWVLIMHMCVGTRVCASYVCVCRYMCVGVRPSGTDVTAFFSSECREGSLGPRKEQRVPLTTESSLQLQFSMLEWWGLYKLWFYHVSLVRVTFVGLEKFFLQPHVLKKQLIRNG